MRIFIFFKFKLTRNLHVCNTTYICAYVHACMYIFNLKGHSTLNWLNTR